MTHPRGAAACRPGAWLVGAALLGAALAPYSAAAAAAARCHAIQTCGECRAAGAPCGWLEPSPPPPPPGAPEGAPEAQPHRCVRGPNAGPQFRWFEKAAHTLYGSRRCAAPCQPPLGRHNATLIEMRGRAVSASTEASPQARELATVPPPFSFFGATPTCVGRLHARAHLLARDADALRSLLALSQQDVTVLDAVVQR